MAARGLELSEVRLSLDPARLVAREPGVQIDHFRLCLSPLAVERLLPPDTPLKQVERMEDGRIWLRVEAGRVSGSLEIRPGASHEGRIRIEILGVRAGRIPIPGLLWKRLLRSRLPVRPGLFLAADNRIEVDLVVLLRRKGVRIAPVRLVQVTQDLLEIVVGDPVA